MRTSFDNIQSLRGLASLTIVLHHVGELESRMGVGLPLLGLFHWCGNASIDVFFVVSGFIIAHANADRFGRPRELPTYLVRRAWRIYPTYWVALGLAALAVAYVGSPDLRGLDWSGSAACWFGLWPGQHLFLPQGWTLTFELMFYVAFGVLLVVPRRAGVVLLTAWAAVVVAAFVRPFSDPVAATVTAPYVLEFLAGCVLAGLVRGGRHGGERIALGVAVVWAVAASLIFSRRMPEWPIVAAGPRVLAFGPPAVLVVYAAIGRERRTGRRLPAWTRTLGDASYSIYLIHWPVMVAMFTATATWSHRRLPHAGWVVAMVTACVGAGLLMYRLVERPLVNLMSSKPRPPAGPRLHPLGRLASVFSRTPAA